MIRVLVGIVFVEVQGRRGEKEKKVEENEEKEQRKETVREGN
jgi:hypothetical protein